MDVSELTPLVDVSGNIQNKTSQNDDDDDDKKQGAGEGVEDRIQTPLTKKTESYCAELDNGSLHSFCNLHHL